MTLQLAVPSIVCSGCADKVTQAVQGVDPAATVDVNLESKEVTIETSASEEAVKEAIVATGHTVS